MFGLQLTSVGNLKIGPWIQCFVQNMMMSIPANEMDHI